MTEEQNKLNELEKRVAAFLVQHLNTGAPPSTDFDSYWQSKQDSDYILDFDKSQISSLGINQLLILSLFVRPGLLVEKDKDPSKSETSITCCQPDVSAKRIHTSKDVESFTTTGPYEQAPITAVVYKAEKVSSMRNDSPIVPMIFPASKRGCCLEEVINPRFMAVQAKEGDFQQAIDILFPDWDGGETPADCDERSFDVVFMAMCQAFDLTKPKGWLKLLKRLHNSPPSQAPHTLNLQNLYSFTSLLFAVKINFSVAILTGEGPIFSWKQRLMSGKANFELPNKNSHNHRVSTSFRLLQNDYGLHQQSLKGYSHKQRTTFASSSQSGSLKDLVMETALKIVQRGTSAVVSEVDEETDLDQYGRLLQKNHANALDTMLATRGYNPHVYLIVESHVKLNKIRNSTPEEDDADDDEAYPPRKDFLNQMKNVKFNAAPSRKRVAKEMSWIINLLTQFDDPSSAAALFSLLCNDDKSVFLPAGYANKLCFNLSSYVHFWDEFFKTRQNIAAIVYNICQTNLKPKTRTPKKKKMVLDIVARRLSMPLLDAIATHGGKANHDPEKFDGYPLLLEVLSKKGTTNTFAIMELLFKVAAEAGGNGSISFGSALLSDTSDGSDVAELSNIEFAKQLQTSKLLAFNRRDLDLRRCIAKFLSGNAALLSQVEELLRDETTRRKAQKEAQQEGGSNRSSEVAATPTEQAATPTQEAATPTQEAATPTQEAATPTEQAATPTGQAEQEREPQSQDDGTDGTRRSKKRSCEDATNDGSDSEVSDARDDEDVAKLKFELAQKDKALTRLMKKSDRLKEKYETCKGLVQELEAILEANQIPSPFQAAHATGNRKRARHNKMGFDKEGKENVGNGRCNTNRPSRTDTPLSSKSTNTASTAPRRLSPRRRNQ